jgi:REP element-mobilizing transposase RayT
MSDRLRRLDRIYIRGPVYFVTACTAGRAPLLARPEVNSAFLKFAEDGPRNGAWIGAYVLMPDHIHAFVALDEERADLSSWMKSLKHALSKALGQVGVAGPCWQKGFFDYVLRSEESASEKWEYVRQNPVRAGLVRGGEAWPYLGEVFDLDYRVQRL